MKLKLLLLMMIFTTSLNILCKKNNIEKVVIIPIQYNLNKYLYNKLAMVCSRISNYFYLQKKIRNKIFTSPDPKWTPSIHYDKFNLNNKNYCHDFKNKNVRFLIIVNSIPIKLDILYDLDFSIIDVKNDCRVHKCSINYRLKTQTADIVNKKIIKIVDELTEIILKNE